MKNEVLPKDFSSTVKDIKLAILQARAKAAHLANAEALKLYFFVGGYISKKTRNAKWGSGAINALSERLQVELPGLRGFSAMSMKYMRLFFEAWADTPEIRHLASVEFGDSAFRHLASVEFRQLPTAEICDTENRYLLSSEIRPLPTDELEKDDIAAFFSIGFTHHREIIRFCKNFDERLYYIHACAKGMWSVEQLLEHLRADDYHHIGALPNNFEKTLSPMTLATQAVRSFKDEYLLDLVNLDNVDARYGYETDERVLSKSMVANIEKTIQALGGNDFCFMGREKRLVIEDEEFFVDLLFFHRGFKAMVAIELKMGDFHPGYLGQLNFYLSALDKLMKKPDENPTIGLLLCEKVNKPVVQLAVQGYSKPIGIATYQALRNIPEPYKTLAPVIDGVRRVLAESAAERKPRKRSFRKKTRSY
jgi:predicted nuclease of restriction endonuclease-like (RecB) superfamily